MSSSSSCLGRAAVPVKRVWRGLLSARLGRPRRRTGTTTGKLSTTYVPVNHPEEDRSDDGDMGVGAGVLEGLGRLRKDVRTCEYRDVHVMWEMLSSSSNGGGGGGSGRVEAGMTWPARRRKGRKHARWNRLVVYCGAF